MTGSQTAVCPLFPVSGSCQKVNFCVNFLPGNKNFVIIVKPDKAGFAEKLDIGMHVFVVAS